MFKKLLRALAVGGASVGAASLASFGLDKAKADAPQAVKVAAKFVGAGVGAGIAMAVLKD